ncbi:MAG: hypothetical protein IJ466_12150 [Clostridia bacterium]|nr:hypothetical protein [Clostridia bacterium]
MKRVIVLCVAVAVMVTVIVTGSVAYFTDSVAATGNMIRSGSLDIVQYEMERGTGGTLVDFSQDKALLPSVSTSESDSVTVNAQLKLGGNDVDKNISNVSFVMEKGNPQNYVDKIVCVENTGTLPTYVRTFVAVPTNYVGGVKTEWIHLDFNADPNSGWTLLKEDGTTPNIIPNQEIDGVIYDIYVATSTRSLAAGTKEKPSISNPSLVGFYMDSRVSNENGNFVYINGDNRTILWPTSNQSIEILVKTEAAQANYFDEFVETAAEGSPYHGRNAAFLALETTFALDANNQVIENYHPWLAQDSDASNP